MHLLLEGVAKEKQDSVSQLIRDNKSLHRWIVSHALQLVAFQLMNDDDSVVVDSNSVQTRKKLDFCFSFGALIMAEYKRDSGKEISLPLAEALLQVFEYVFVFDLFLIMFSFKIISGGGILRESL
jgi:hypothetical protein